MRFWIIHKLRAMIDWITPYYPNSLALRAEHLIDAAESFDNASGEYKRHRVYAQLKKEFPMVRGRDLGYLIESVLQGKK